MLSQAWPYGLNAKLKVFIDDKPLRSGHTVRGIGSYARNLIDALKQERKIQLVDKMDNSDVVHYPYFDLFFNTLKITNKPTVVTVFDTIPLIYPKHYLVGIRGRVNLWLQKGRLKRINTVVTISETSKKDVVRFLDIPQDKIDVVYLAPGDEFKKVENTTALHSILVKYNLPEKFVLYVGDVNYNKNIAGLVHAFARLDSKNLGLVLVGAAFQNDNLSETQGIKQLVKRYGLEYKVITPGFVPADDLVKVYNLATVYCQPSLYEGFGLSVLEAMACGCPVVAAKTQALVEIAEGKCIFVDPKNPESIATGLLESIENKSLRKRLIDNGMAHVKNFSWEKTAKETIEIYQKALHV